MRVRGYRLIEAASWMLAAAAVVGAVVGSPAVIAVCTLGCIATLVANHTDPRYSRRLEAARVLLLFAAAVIAAVLSWPPWWAFWT